MFRFVRTQTEEPKQNKLLYCEDYLTNPSFKECSYSITNILTIYSETTSSTTTQNNLDNLMNIFSIHVGYVCGAEKILKIKDTIDIK